MNKDYYFRHLIGKRDINKLNYKNKIYEYVKKQFYNYNTYKWSVKKYKTFVFENNVNFEIVYKALEDICKLHFNNKRNLGKKGFEFFLTQIKKLNNNNNDLSKIKIKNNKIEFLIKFSKLRDDYLDMTNEEYINFIHKSFNTEFKKSVLRLYYYENKIKE